MADKTAILDQFGRPIETPQADQIRAFPMATSIQDRYSLLASNDMLSPDNLTSIFREAETGDVGRMIELADRIYDQDAHVRALIGKRIRSVTSLTYIIEPGDDSDAARKAADAFRDAWDKLNHRKLIRILQRATLSQWSVAEIRWDVGSVWKPIGFRRGDARRIIWPSSDHPADGADPALPQISRTWTMMDRVNLSPGNFVVHSVDADDCRPGIGAPVRSVAMLSMLKRFALIDLGTLLEVFGRPWKAIKYRDGLPREQIMGILDVVRRAAADMCIALPQNAELQLIQGLSSGGEGPHVAAIDLYNREQSKALLGTTTITDAAAGNDNVSSPTHADVALETRDDDALAICETIRSDLAVPFTLWNYGANVPAPKISANLAPKKDPAQRGAVYKLAAEIGITQVKSQQVYEELEIEKPGDVPEVIELRVSGGSGSFPFATDLPTGPDKTQTDDEGETEEVDQQKVAKEAKTEVESGEMKK